MHLTILALGSRGDVVPYINLGQALKAAGHQIRFITFENFEPLAVNQGLDFFPIRGDMQHILTGDGGQALAESGKNPLRMAWSALRLFGVMADGIARDLSAPVLGETDLIINQLPGGMFGFDLAEKYAVPMILAAVMPLTPTKYAPMLAFPGWLAPLPGYNSLTHWLAYQLVWQGYRPAVNRWREGTLGLSKAPLWGYSRAMDARQITVLNGFSEHLVPRPADWGPHIHITGYWFPEEETWAPPEDLSAFLAAGPAPIFIGFGSMPLRDPQGTAAMLLEALELGGQRGILQMGWGGLAAEELPDLVFNLDYAPYGWLFPRMAAVVHHGGSGTTAFGLRAGIPSIIVPFLFDQFYWGRRVAELGVGPPPIPHKKLSALRLAGAMTVAVNDEEMAQTAAGLGQKIRAEDGLGAAVDEINARLANK
jgi:UDP:flavonoid glycosyltransferase YjiC (YdhE family)